MRPLDVRNNDLYTWKNWKQDLKEKLVHPYSLLHYSQYQELEGTYVFMNRWTDKQNAVCNTMEYYLALKKEGNSGIFYDMYEP